MASLGDLFSSRSAVGQLFLYGVLGGVLSSLLQPELAELTQLSYGILANTPLPADQAARLAVQGHMTEAQAAGEAGKAGINGERFAALLAGARVHLSPADLATMVVRNILTEDQAVTIAKLSGLQPADFARLVQATGQPPGPATLAEAARRGIIDWDGVGPDKVSFAQGLSEGDTKDKYGPMLRALAVQWPSPADALDALLEGQISEAEAKQLYQRFGGDPAYFKMLFDTRGGAPTPTQAADMANRGIIAWTGTGPDATSFEQSFLEGPWRNKWEPAFRKAAAYVTPPRSVVAMLRNGALTPEQASAELRLSGLDDAMIAAYIHEAQQGAGATQRELTMSQTVALYEAQVIGHDDARKLLEALGYDQHNAGFLLQLADLRREIAAVNYAVGRVQALYVGRKLTRNQAAQSLNTLGLPAAQVKAVVDTWDIVLAATVKTLTAAEIGRAAKAGYLDAATALADLVAQGYSPHDAWIVLSLAIGGPAPNPPPGVTLPGPTPQ